MNSLNKGKKETLTLKQMQKVFESLPPSEDLVIKTWQYPFLWMLWMFRGTTYIGEHWKMYAVTFRGVYYLLKSKELK